MFIKNILTLVPLVIASMAVNQIENRGGIMPTLEEVNVLASPDYLRTEADANTYVDALWKFFGLESLGSINGKELKQRIARAELSAVHDPNRRISSERIAAAFNGLMAQLSAPSSMRITQSEVSTFRQRLAHFPRGRFVFPNLFARTSDGMIDQRSRPVEALVLIYLLQYGPNIEAARQEVDLIVRENQHSKVEFIQRPTVTTPNQRETDYSAAVNLYFRTHAEADLIQSGNRLLDQLL